MKIHDCEQRSEEWEVLRMGRPTASNFGRIVAPAKGQLSKSHIDYACELIAKQMGVYTEPPPSYWMEWGTENEPLAIESYVFDTGCEVEKVGFVTPDDHDRYGCSPDGFIDGRSGLVEIKCPKPETLLKYHISGELPSDYKPQVQGQLLITGCEYCDFYAFHPEMAPFKVRVFPDMKYQAAMEKALEQFCESLESMRDRISQAGIHLIKWGE